ncbi:MAG: DUF4349 domain-containing protein [Pseudomonadota bacterium]
MRALFALISVGLGLAACSPDNTTQTRKTGEAADTSATMTEAAAPRADGKPATVAVSVPQLAYAWSLGFLVPDDKLASAQDRHRSMCEDMGAARCQILSLERGTGTDQTGAGTLKLRVVSNEARAFSNQLSNVIEDAGGRSTDTKVEGEDVSKSIIDTEARIRQRELLVARLTNVLRTRKGSVGELVEAERSVTAAQEELEQARAWLKEQQGRVAMSEFQIRYMAITASANAESVGAQLGDATQASAATFLIGLRTFFTLAIYLLPWALLVFPVVMVVRWLRRKNTVTPA